MVCVNNGLFRKAYYINMSSKTTLNVSKFQYCKFIYFLKSNLSWKVNETFWKKWYKYNFSITKNNNNLHMTH